MYPNIKRIKNTRLLINRLQYKRKKNNMQINLTTFPPHPYHLILFPFPFSLFPFHLSPYLTTQSPTPKDPPFRQLRG